MTKDDERQIDNIARELTRELFTSGTGERAFRLVLVDKNGKDLGGMVECSVEGQIRSALLRRLKAGETVAAVVRKKKATGG